MSVKPQSADFWNEAALEKEWRRVFDICHGCRRCFHLCPSFDFLFAAIDRTKEESVEELTAADFQRVLDLCYQCKLCYNHCPYTPPHRWGIDYPRLMLRAKAVQVRRQGLPLSDRLLGNTDLVGRLGSLTAPMANLANRNRLNRSLVQGVMGIHKDRGLPIYHRQTFAGWFRKQASRRRNQPTGNGKVVLFYTCFVNYNQPDIGKAAVAVLEKNGITVQCPRQRCCGMPYLDGGDVKSATNNAAFNVNAMAEYVRMGYQIVVPGPTCSYMLKQEYPFLLDSDEARAVAEATYDICEYLMDLHRQGRLNTDFPRSAGRIAYHLPCHLKAQNIGYKSADLLKLIPETTVELMERCAGIDGTWGLKRQHFALSLEVARPLLRNIEDAHPDIVVSDCPLAAMQIEQGTGVAPKHPLQVLRMAYGL